MKKILLLIALVLLSCTDETAARRALRSQGFTDVQITGYSWLECGEDDFSHTGFRAKNPHGEIVTGTVCCGFIAKGCTIRY